MLSKKEMQSESPYRKGVIYFLLLMVLGLSVWAVWSHKRDQNKEAEQPVAIKPENTPPPVSSQKPLKLVQVKPVQPVRASTPKVVSVAPARAQKVGEGLISKGKMPALDGQIDLSWPEYQSWYRSNQSVLTVYDRHSQNIFRVNGSELVPMKSTRGYSNRTRNVTSDTPVSLREELFAKARTMQPGGAFLLLVLNTEQEEARFIGRVAHALSQVGLSFNEVDLIRYRYINSTEGARLSIDSATVSGQNHQIGIQVSL